MPSKEIDIHFASVGGAYVDFSVLDLSPWGIQGGLIEKSDTEDFIRSISMRGHADKTWETVKNVSQGIECGSGLHEDYKEMNLLWPIDLNHPPKESDFFEAVEAIRVVHPSELYVYSLHEAQYFKGKGIQLGLCFTYFSYGWSKYQEHRKHYFDYPEGSLEETNKFLAFYKKNYGKRDYITNAINYYSDSFRTNSLEMAFVCLCICLETIVPGREQLSFRFRRNLAVLCSESLEEGKCIFKKAKRLYEHRSKLVHSGMNNKDFEKFGLFFEYAQVLASRMIVEMLLHDMSKIEDLDKKITELGFGQRGEISQDYKEFKGNGLTWYKVSKYEF